MRYSLDPLCLAEEFAWRSGIVVVVSAGNEGRNNFMRTSGYASITAPGNDAYLITVGAMKTMGMPGKGDDLIAPGNRIGSALAANGTLSEKSSSLPFTIQCRGRSRRIAISFMAAVLLNRRSCSPPHTS